MEHIGITNIANSLHENKGTTHDVYKTSNNKTIAIDNSIAKLKQNTDGTYTVNMKLTEEQLEAMYGCKVGKVLQYKV